MRTKHATGTTRARHGTAPTCNSFRICAASAWYSSWTRAFSCRACSVRPCRATHKKARCYAQDAVRDSRKTPPRNAKRTTRETDAVRSAAGESTGHAPAEAHASWSRQRATYATTLRRCRCGTCLRQAPLALLELVRHGTVRLLLPPPRNKSHGRNTTCRARGQVIQWPATDTMGEMTGEGAGAGVAPGAAVWR
jgi:hypothetical protein